MHSAPIDAIDGPHAVGSADLRDRHMSRGLAQLLFTYLPGRVVDWEDGTAVVQLTHPRLRSVWSDDRARIVLEEVAAYLVAWRDHGGTVSSNFPDPLLPRPRVVVGEPDSIAARPLEGALICRRCARLVFRTHAQLTAAGGRGFLCPSCETRTLRQFGQVFVHGCGELVAVTEFLPWMKEQDGVFQESKLPVKCQTCGPDAILEIPARTERARDMRIACRRCKNTIYPRLKARCPACVKQIILEQKSRVRLPMASLADESEPAREERTGTAVARVAMRLANSRANDAYYAHTLSRLRLDRPTIVEGEDDEIRLLLGLLPPARQPDVVSTGLRTLQALLKRIEDATRTGDVEAATRLRSQLAAAAAAPVSAPVSVTGNPPVETDVEHSIEESLAFRSQVRTRPAVEAAAALQGPTRLLLPRIADQQRALGLERISLVDDLPVIVAAFGYTRRSYEPTYDEEALGARKLPTELRPFYTVDQRAASRLDRLDLIGCTPILAREGEHEGIFISLDPGRVSDWLGRNGHIVPSDRNGLLRQTLSGLEPIDRYYDRIWELPIRRLLYGLIHSLSHAIMRVLGPLAGLERTSLAEYIFLPLLGTVVYASSTTMNMGVMETVIRDHLHALLDGLASDGVECLYDPDCLDRRGACHGCLHAPEISCRAFNHGLSRSFLIGGHKPWADPAREADLTGYWE